MQGMYIRKQPNNRRTMFKGYPIHKTVYSSQNPVYRTQNYGYPIQAAIYPNQNAVCQSQNTVNTVKICYICASTSEFSLSKLEHNDE